MITIISPLLIVICDEDPTEIAKDASNNINDHHSGIYVSAETISLVSFGLGIFTIIFLVNCTLCIYNCTTLRNKYSKSYGYRLRTLSDSDIGQ